MNLEDNKTLGHIENRAGNASPNDVVWLIHRLKEQDREIERLGMQLDASRKIRRYSAFVLAGDENADLQIVADQVKAEIERLTFQVKGLSVERTSAKQRAEKAERLKLIGALEWAIEYIDGKEHYYFLNIHASDKEALKQARAVLSEVKEKR